MAMYPCTFGPNHRFSGAQRSAYISRASTNRPSTLKHRLCKQHANTLEALCDVWLSTVTPETPGEQSKVCEAYDCVNPRSETFYVRLFNEQGSEPDEFIGELCELHADTLADELQWRSMLRVGDA